MDEFTQQSPKFKGANEKFCQECGAIINAKAEICPKCGVRNALLPSIHAPAPAAPTSTPNSSPNFGPANFGSTPSSAIPQVQNYDTSSPSFGAPPPMIQTASVFGPSTQNGRNRVIAALLAFFLGGFGIHKFYLGRGGVGVLYLIFCWTFIPTFIAFIDLIVLLVMSDTAFNLKYGRN